MSIKIIVDSACDIIPADAQKDDVSIIPLKLTFGETEYLDAVTITHDEFFEKLIESDVLPTTSQISPYEYEQTIRDALAKYDEVLLITISSKLSGCYQNACLAAQDFEGRVKVFDSMNASLGEGLLVMDAVKLRDEGLSLDEIYDRLMADRDRVCVLALLDTLEYLKKGGRISAATAMAGTLLSIKPVIAVYKGEVCLLGKARGSKNANNKLNELIQEKGSIDTDLPIRLAYSGSEKTMLLKYITDSMHLFPEEVNPYAPGVICSIGSTIGTHIGPGAIGVFFFAK